MFIAKAKLPCQTYLLMFIAKAKLPSQTGLLMFIANAQLPCQTGLPTREIANAWSRLHGHAWSTAVDTFGLPLANQLRLFFFFFFFFFFREGT